MPVLKVRVAAHLAHGGVAAGRATIVPLVCAAVLEISLRRAGSATSCAPVPPCGGPWSGSAIFAVKPSGLVEINPRSFAIGNFYTEVPGSFKLSHISPFVFRKSL
jgi:hypothetical protein